MGKYQFFIRKFAEEGCFLDLEGKMRNYCTAGVEFLTANMFFFISGSIQITRVRGLSQAVPFPERPDVSL
jgi:hypothetical protein